MENRSPTAVVTEPGFIGWKQLFTIDCPLGRTPYVLTGLALGAAKYVIEAAIVFTLTGQFYTPAEFVNPWLSSKASFLVEHEVGTYIGIGWILFTLPFVWIAVSMSWTHGHCDDLAAGA